MRFKKIFAVIMTAVVAFVFSVPSYAYSENRGNEISPQYTLARDSVSYLTTSGTSAKCDSNASGLSTKVTSITVVQTLQKEWLFGIFFDVPEASWTKSVNGTYISIVNTKSGLESGTYRVKAVFTLTAKDGTSETVTVYSDSKVI